MKLDLESKLTPEEIMELRKRAFSFAEQMFFEGISTGRELNREPLQEKAEKFIKDKLSAMTSFLIRDDVWEVMPAQGYNPNPNVELPDVSSEMANNMDKSFDTAQNMQGVVNNPSKTDAPDWALNQETPEWAKDKKPFK